MKELLYLIIIVLGIPVGLLLAKMCRDETRKWRKRLNIISIICFILGILIWFINFEYKIPVIITLGFIIITNLTIVLKSKNHKK